MTSGNPPAAVPDTAMSHGARSVPCWEDSYTTTLAFGARAAITSRSAATSVSTWVGAELAGT